MNKKENKHVFVTMNLVTNFFVEIIVAMAIGFFLGKWLDKLLFEDKTILTIVLLFLGLIGALVNFIKRILKSVDGGNKNEES